MRQRQLLCLIWGIFVLGLTSPCLGQEDNVQNEPSVGNFVGIGARALGMGGAHLAVAEDISALYWNPAGLARIRRIELAGGLFHERINNRSTFLSAQSSKVGSHTRVNAVGFTLPVPTYRGSLVFAVGYHRLGNFDSILNLEGGTAQIRVEGLELRSGGLHAWTLGGAIDISPSISAGASLLLWRGEETYQWNKTVVDSLDSLQVIDDRFTDKYFGASLKLGLLVRLGQYVSIGGALDSPVRYKVEEEGFMSKETIYYPSTSPIVDKGPTYFDYKLSLPYRFSAGVALTLPRLIVALDINYADWAQIEYKEPGDLVTHNRYISDNYRDVVRWHVGVEYLIPLTKAKLRAGYYRDPIPYRSDEIDNERDYLTVGMGFLIDQVMTVDVAWVHGLWERVGDTLEEEYKVDRIFLTTAYRF